MWISDAKTGATKKAESAGCCGVVISGCNSLQLRLEHGYLAKNLLEIYAVCPDRMEHVVSYVVDLSPRPHDEIGWLWCLKSSLTHRSWKKPIWGCEHTGLACQIPGQPRACQSPTGQDWGVSRCTVSSTLQKPLKLCQEVCNPRNRTTKQGFSSEFENVEILCTYIIPQRRALRIAIELDLGYAVLPGFCLLWATQSITVVILLVFPWRHKGLGASFYVILIHFHSFSPRFWYVLIHLLIGMARIPSRRAGCQFSWNWVLEKLVQFLEAEWLSNIYRDHLLLRYQDHPRYLRLQVHQLCFLWGIWNRHKLPQSTHGGSLLWSLVHRIGCMCAVEKG